MFYSITKQAPNHMYSKRWMSGVVGVIGEEGMA
jgi:hypothetical protein